ANLPEPVGAELRREEVPHDDREVLGRRHPPAKERVGVQVRMVEALDHGLADDPLELAEVDHHPRLWIDRPPDRDVEHVIVAVSHRGAAEGAVVVLWRPLLDRVAVGRGEGEAPSAVREVPAHGRISTKRWATRTALGASPWPRPTATRSRSGRQRRTS